MSRIFTRRFRVRWSETNADGQVDLAGYLRYLVETAWDWGAAGGLSLDEINALGQVWLVRETQLDLLQPLRYNDVFDFSIWLLGWRRVRGTRAFELRLQDGGQVVARGVQQVAVLDAGTMRPTSAPEDLLASYALDNPRQVPSQRFPRIPSPPEPGFVMERRVEARDLDQLNIVENTVYASYAEEAVCRKLAAAGRSPADLASNGLSIVYRRFHAQYQSPAVWGDRLEVLSYLLRLGDTGGDSVVAIRRASDGGRIADCILRWALVDRDTGEVRPLPESLSVALRTMVVEHG